MSQRPCLQISQKVSLDEMHTWYELTMGERIGMNEESVQSVCKC
jgi:hypothetical protein